MAIFKTNSIDMEFNYHIMRDDEIIEYSCNVNLATQPLLNPIFFGNTYLKNSVIFSFDLSADIFIDFFVNIFKTKQGNKISDDIGNFSLRAETWNDKKQSIMEGWKGKTVMTIAKEGDEAIKEDYTSVMNELFVPIFEEQIELNLEFNPCLLPNFNKENNLSNIIIKAETNFNNLALFTAELIKEQGVFLAKFD